MSISEKTVRSGIQGELKVFSVFGLREPTIEVKSAGKHNYQVVLKMSQLERQAWLDYVIVVYDRQCRRLTKGKRKGALKPTITIEQAYKQPVEFLVVPGHTLIDMIIKKRSCVRFVRDRGGPNGAFVTYIRLNLLREFLGGEPELLESGDTLLGGRPRPQEENKEIATESIPLFEYPPF